MNDLGRLVRRGSFNVACRSHGAKTFSVTHGILPVTPAERRIRTLSCLPICMTSTVPRFDFRAIERNPREYTEDDPYGNYFANLGCFCTLGKLFLYSELKYLAHSICLALSRFLLVSNRMC